MTTDIYYFTGTGNSYFVAREISSQMKGVLIPIKDTLIKENIFLESDITGIVFPSYYMHLPRIVEGFLKKLNDIENKYIFVVVTVGGIAGKVFNRTEEILKKRGGKLSGAFVVRMPANYIDAADTLPVFLQRRMFRKSKQKIKKIVTYIEQKQRGKIERFNPIGTLLFAKLIIKKFNQGLFNPDIDKNFWIDERCTFCGICLKICPVNNIKIVNGSIVWKGYCEKCLACIQWCPVTSIQFSDKTVKRKRYHHPDVTIKEMIKIADNQTMTIK